MSHEIAFINKPTASLPAVSRPHSTGGTATGNGHEEGSDLLVQLQERADKDQKQFIVPKFKEHCSYCNVNFLNFYDAREHNKTISHRQKVIEFKRKKALEDEERRRANAPKPVHVREMFLKNAERKVRRLRSIGQIKQGDGAPNASAPVEKMKQSILQTAKALMSNAGRAKTPQTYRGPWAKLETEFGETFYYNHTTGAKQWDRPDDMPPVNFKAGMAVQCRFQGKQLWFDGRIMRPNSDGTFNVKYDDGDIERNVPAKFIRVPVRSQAQAQFSSKPDSDLSKLDIAEAASIGEVNAIKALIAEAAMKAPQGRNEEETAEYRARAVKDFVNQRDEFYKRTPLHDAARYGQVAAIRVLLDAGADPNEPDVYGKIPIEFASGLSDPADVQWVQCTRPGCFKHRKLPASVFTPKPFECIKNRWDPPRADCTAPQESGCPYLLAVEAEAEREREALRKQKKLQLMLSGGIAAVREAEAKEKEEKELAESQVVELPPLTQRYNVHHGGLHEVAPSVRASKQILLHSIEQQRQEAAARKARITHESTADGRHVLTEQRRKRLEEEGRTHMLKFESAYENREKLDWTELVRTSMKDHLRTHIRKNNQAASNYIQAAEKKLQLQLQAGPKTPPQTAESKQKRLAKQAKQKLDSLAVKEFRVRTEWNRKRSLKLKAIVWLQRVLRGRLDRVRFRLLKEKADKEAREREKRQRAEEKAEYYRLNPSAKLKELANRNLRKAQSKAGGQRGRGRANGNRGKGRPVGRFGGGRGGRVRGRGSGGRRGRGKGRGRGRGLGSRARARR